MADVPDSASLISLEHVSSSSCYIRSTTVTVCVGIEKEEFCVYKNLICTKFTYFDKALNGSFVEAKSRTVRLEHISVPLFSIFVSWLYSGRLVYVVPPGSDTTIAEDFFPLLCKANTEENEQKELEQFCAEPATAAVILSAQTSNVTNGKGKRKQAQSGHVNTEREDAGFGNAKHTTSSNNNNPASQDPILLDIDEEDASTWPLDIIAKLYILGDYFGVQQFKNNVISAIDGPSTWNRGLNDADVPTRPLIRFIYDNTPPKSPLRDLIVDLVVYGQIWWESNETWEDLPAEFLAKVMVSLGRRLPPKQCGGCYSRAMTRNGLSEADADRVYLTANDMPQFGDNACFYHEHETEQEREKCRQEE
ncbi:hypothetical protein KCU91_g15613, partial [Aureobasidium melanogenum]